MSLSQAPIDTAQTAVQTLTALPDAAKSSQGAFELPTGYLDAEGTLHTTLHVREMTGDEEDILASKRMQAHAKVQKILEACVTQVGTVTREGNSDWSKVLRDLTATDRLFAVIKIREVTLGSAYTFKSKCPACSDVHEQAVSLSDFKVTPPKDPRARTWTGTLPKSGLSYTAKVQTGGDEAKLAKVEESKDLMSLGMMARVVSLGGKQPVTLGMVKNLSLADRAHLRRDFDAHEADIENKADVECPECGNEYETRIEVGDPNFFFPSAT